MNDYHSITTGPAALPPGKGKKDDSGWGLMIPGFIMLFIGMILSGTLIGACIGIPLVIAGITMVIMGKVKYQKKALDELKESVRAGVLQGIQIHQSKLPAEPIPDGNQSQTTRPDSE